MRAIISLFCSGVSDGYPFIHFQDTAEYTLCLILGVPDTLNLKSKGRWVTSYIELPVGYDIDTIDLEGIRLNDQIPITHKPIEIGDYDENGIPDLMVKFDRSAVQSILGVGEKVKITITGKLINGKPFEGRDIIRVIERGKK